MSEVVDQSARLRALDPGDSFIVQAPAGSGKTELLTQRFLALLATVRRPEEILAITFTRKAAAEMRHRLLQALAGAEGPAPEAGHQRRTWELAGKVLARDRKQGWKLSATPGRLAIQTIDSFNAALARRMPWLTGFGGMPRMSEDPAVLYRLAARRTLDRVAGGGSGSEAAARLLNHLDNQMERLQEMLVGMLQRRDQWLRHIGGGDLVGARNDLEGALADYIRAELQRCRSRFPAHLWPELAPLARFAADQTPGERPLAALAGLTSLPGETGEDLALWQGLADLLLTKDGDLRRRVDRNCGFPAAKEGPAADCKAAMKRLLEDPALARWAPSLAKLRHLPAPRYGENQWQVLAALTELLRLCVAELWLVFSERGEADFAEVALRALDALGSAAQPTDLLLQLDMALRHILIDEFQDTSHLQFALLQRLLAGWQPGDGRTLFLVGDPMQSIYRFREAEVGLFLRAWREGIGAVRLEPLRLQTNFRSRAGVVEWINACFAALFPVTEDPSRGAVCYSPATAVHGGETGAAVTVLGRPERDDEAEARQVRDLVRQALARGDESVAVLVRARTHLQAILPALRAAGLHYRAQDVDLLAERPAARDLAALTRAILHGGDRLAWLSILRAPWCGLQLADLEALCGDAPDKAIPCLLEDTRRLDRLSPDGRRRAGRMHAVLQRAGAQRGRLGLRRLIEGCWVALGGPLCYGASGQEDAGRVLDLLESLEQGGDLESLESLEEGLQRLFAAPDAEADGTLQVMTIHRAKGLEFDTVILPGLGLQTGHGDPPLLRWQELAAGDLLVAPIAPGDGSRDPIYDAIGRLEKEKEAFETIRLLYVAATRARRRLYLLGHARQRSDGDCRPPGGSLLEVLWPAVAQDFEGLEPPGDSEEGGAAQDRSSLRRLPVDWQPPAFVPAPLPGSEAPVRPSAAGAEDRGEPVAGLAARHAGSVLHLLLERIAREGAAAWSRERLAGLEAEIRGRLRREGIAGRALDAGVERVRRGLETATHGPNGRWVLRRHRDAAVELGISSPDVAKGVVDRTFIDEQGRRWIIDYKTSEPRQGEGRTEFFNREEERYRRQLAGYRELFAALEPEREIRAGLYFPMLDGWLEMPVGS